MTVDTAIKRFRNRQAAQFSQRCNVHRPFGEMVFDPETSQSSQPVDLVHSNLPCKVTSEDRSGNDVEAGQTQVRIVDLSIKFPVGTDIEPDDLVTITSSTYDSIDVGRQYRVTDVDRREWQISRRCSLEETLVPMLWEEES